MHLVTVFARRRRPDNLVDRGLRWDLPSVAYSLEPHIGLLIPASHFHNAVAAIQWMYPKPTSRRIPRTEANVTLGSVC